MQRKEEHVEHVKTWIQCIVNKNKFILYASMLIIYFGYTIQFILICQSYRGLPPPFAIEGSLIKKPAP